MSEALRNPSRVRSLRIPLWDGFGQAERFAGLLALAALFAAIPYLVAERMLVAEVYFGLATLWLGLCTGSARGGPRWVLGIGTPLSMLLGGVALLAASGAVSVVSMGLLVLAAPVARLWSGSERFSWGCLIATIGLSVALGVLGGASPPAGEPWLSDPRTPWSIGPLALAGFALARSWDEAHAAWQQEVLATHAVLAASEARFKAYVENAHDLIAELDAAGRVLFVTARRDAHRAPPAAELLGARGIEFIHPGDRDVARRCFAAAAAGRANVSPPLRYHDVGGEWRLMRVAVSSYRTHRGEPRFVLQARDELASPLLSPAPDPHGAEAEAPLG